MVVHPRGPLPGWLNCWSLGTCAHVGFSLERHGALFERVEELAGHGFLLQLTGDPLDLERPEHMARLEALCRALPALAHTEWR